MLVVCSLLLNFFFFFQQLFAYQAYLVTSFMFVFFVVVFLHSLECKPNVTLTLWLHMLMLN